jgi:hypothetical protein
MPTRTMTVQNLKNLQDSDLDATVWRYFPFAKFISMLTYQALWFCKLNVLQDKFEGMIPRKPPELLTTNERDGRELTLVNCWFLGDSESMKMWDTYGASPEGVAVKSTVRQLMQYVYVPADPHMSHIGKVLYVEHDDYDMEPYLAHQAHERAFLKDERYSNEQELRIETLNVKHMSCVSKYGKPFTLEECQCKNMNNFDNPGLYFMIDLRQLPSGFVVAPRGHEWFELLVRRIIEALRIPTPVTRSALEARF